MNISGRETLVDRISDARARMEAQVKAAELQGEMCNRLRALRTPAVNAEFSTFPAYLQEYIAKLEKEVAGIWCGKCQTVKNVGELYTQKTPEEERAELLAAATAANRRHIAEVSDRLDELRDDFKRGTTAFEGLVTRCTGEMSRLSKTIAGFNATDPVKRPVSPIPEDEESSDDEDSKRFEEMAKTKYLSGIPKEMMGDYDGDDENQY